MTKSNLAVIPCEYCGNDGQFSPVFLLGMDSINKRGYIKYNLENSAFVVNLRELRLAPEAFEPKLIQDATDSSRSFIPRENIEVWLSHDKTCNGNENNLDLSGNPLGSWWPGRVISIHDKFVHCEVLAPKCQQASSKHLSDLNNTKSNISLQAIVVEISDVRLPWDGKKIETSLLCNTDKLTLENRSYISLEDDGVLHQYKMILPDYLSHIFASSDVNANLLKFCGAPCLLTFENQSLDGSNKIKLGIISASAEAIRKAALLEIVHSSLLHERLKVSESNSSSFSAKGLCSKKNSIANSVNGDGNLTELCSRNDDLSRMSSDSPNLVSPTDEVNSNLFNSESSVNNARPMHFTKLTSKVTGKPIYEGSFKINPNLTGIIIGHQGCNISKARQIDGVQEISVNDDIATILADSIEACESAREILDIIEVEIPIFTEITPRIVGTGGDNLRRLVEQSGVRKAFIHKPEVRAALQKNGNLVERYELGVSLNKSQYSMRQMNGNGEEKSEDEQLSAILLIGTRQSINKMRILLEYQFDNWNELSELEVTKRSLQNELRKIDNRPSIANGNNGNYMGRKKTQPTNNTNSAVITENGNVSFKEEDFPLPNQQNRNQNAKYRKNVRPSMNKNFSNNTNNSSVDTNPKHNNSSNMNNGSTNNAKFKNNNEQGFNPARNGSKKFTNGRQNVNKQTKIENGVTPEE